MTSLLNTSDAGVEHARMPISTIADAWIHVTYRSQGGERNRALSINKARGIGHSNQVRELILSETGVRLAKTYVAGGEVLMGTLRWEREEAERRAQRLAEYEDEQMRMRLASESDELNLQIQTLQQRLAAKRAAREHLDPELSMREREGEDRVDELRRLRRSSDPD